MSFLDWTFIVMIVLVGLDLFISPYIEGVSTVTATYYYYYSFSCY